MNKGSPKKPKPEESLKQKAQSTKPGVAHANTKAESIKRKTASSKSPSEIEIPKSEINPTPIATRQTPSPQKMEVHHHPQLEHNPKPWKEYLLEGFMIFIAVMMGFIAENIREDISNKEHVRHLTAQLVRDLEADTTQLNAMFKFELGIRNSNDTLFSLLQQPISGPGLKRIEHQVIGSHGLWPFHSAMGAISAIKNELHLKQFSNSEIIGYIDNYERHIDLMHTVQDITLQYQRLYLDPFLTQHFTPSNLEAAFNKPALVNEQVRNLTQNDLTQLAADVVLIRINTNELIRDNEQVKIDAVNLLKYVKEQYHPEE